MNEDSKLVLSLEDDLWTSANRAQQEADAPAVADQVLAIDEQVVDELLQETDTYSDPLPAQRRSRRRQPASSPRLMIYRLLNSLVDRVQGSRFGLVVLIAVMAISAAVIGYSMTQRGALIHLGYELAAEREHVAAVLDELRLRVATQNLNDVMAGIVQAESRLFPDYHQLAGWLSAQHDYANRLSLDFRYTLGDPSASQVKNVLEVPIAIQVTVTPETGPLGYLAMLEFLKAVIDAHWYVEIDSATLAGEADGASEMNANVQVWVRGELDGQMDGETTVSTELEYEAVIE